MGVWAASLLSAVGLLGVAPAASAPAAATRLPDVTVIGDSVMTGVIWHPAAMAVAQKDLQVRWEVAVCRTLIGVSCPFEGERPPTLVDLVRDAGPTMGKIVVVEAGYNDPVSTYPEAVEESVEALLAAGVRQILWLNLREVSEQFVEMNHVLAAAADLHPELQIVDWNRSSSNEWHWFQGDGIHLTPDGGIGLATLIHENVWRAIAPALVVSPAPFPQARVGQPYAARAKASGGRAPYRWQSVGALPRGLHLRPDGRIDGTPLRRGPVSFELRVTDSVGGTTTELEQILVEPARS